MSKFVRADAAEDVAATLGDGSSILPEHVESIELDGTEGRAIAPGDGYVGALSLSGHFYRLSADADGTSLTKNTPYIPGAFQLLGAHGIGIDDGIAYIGCQQDPDRSLLARVVALQADTATSTITTVGTVGDDTHLATVAGLDLAPGLIAVAASAYGLAIIDRSDPANMSVVGFKADAHLSAPTGVKFVSDTRLLVGSQGAGNNDGLAMVDVTTPSAPAIVGYTINASGAVFAIDTFGAHDEYAVTITSGAANRVDTWRIRNLSTFVVLDTPVHLGTVVDAGMDRPLGIATFHNVAVVTCQGDIGCDAYVDLSDPTTPTYLGRILQTTAGGGGGNGSGEYYHNYPSYVDATGLHWTTAHGIPPHATTTTLNYIAPPAVPPTIKRLVKLNGAPVFLS